MAEKKSILFFPNKLLTGIMNLLREQAYSPFLLLALFLLAVCTDTIEQSAPINGPPVEPRQAPPQTYVYECGDGYSFIARIEAEKAWLFLPFQTISLPYVSSASGLEYSNGSAHYWPEGDKAVLAVDSETHRGCRNNRAKAIWEHAKLRGVDFRAVGNEPGWYLEISQSHNIVFVGDYGKTRYEFATPEPVLDQHVHTTTYEVHDDAHSMTIVLKGERCHDSMSGEPFETTVSVILDGKHLRGCGKPLH